MEIHSSLDWPDVASQLRKIGRKAATNPTHLSVYLTNISNLVKQLGNMEVDNRRNKRPPNLQYKELLSKINESITEFEQWITYATLLYG